MSLTESDMSAQHQVRPRVTHRTPLALWRYVPLVLVILFLGCFFFWPLLQVLYRSLSVGGSLSYLQPDFTLQNYYDLIVDPAIVLILKNTIIIAVSSSIVTLAVAFPLAYLMSRVTNRLAIVIYSLILLPLSVNILIRLFGVLQLFARNGPVTWVLEGLGFPEVQLLYN